MSRNASRAERAVRLVGLERAVESPIVSWAEGCRDYLKHLDALKVRSRRETTFGRDDGEGNDDRDGVVAWGVLGRLTRERPRVRW